MRKLACVLGVCALLATVASGAEIAYWNFNNQTNLGSSLYRQNPFGIAGAETEYTRDYGDGAAELSAWGAADASEGNLVGTNGIAVDSGNNWGSYAGTTLNARHADIAGGTLSVAGTALNGKYWLIELDDAIQSCVVSFAYRATGTGHKTQTYDYSTDNGATWTNLSTITWTADSTFHAGSVDFGNVFQSTSGHESNLIRITETGCTTTNGTFRYDNLAVDGTIVPEPASVLLIGLAGLFIRRR